METRELLRFTLKVLVGWSVLSALAFVFREPLGTFLLPFIEFGLRALNHDFSPALALVEKENDHLISLSAWVMHPITVVAGQVVHPGAEMTAGTHLTHTLVPAIITLSLLLAWPSESLLNRLLLLMLGLGMSILVVAVTAPIVLLGHLEILFQDMAANTRRTRPVPFALDAMIFLESGGRWLIAVASALLCVPAAAILGEIPRLFGIKR